MHKKKLPTPSDYTGGNLFSDLKKLEVYIGLSKSNKKIKINFENCHHLIIAGATGSGKSSLLKTIIFSLLLNNSNHDLQFIFIDLKRVELSTFKDLPHTLNFSSNFDDAYKILEKILSIIDERFQMLEKLGLTNISQMQGFYNHLFIVIDEFAELVLTHKKVEKLIVRISQLGRAAGVHLIICTQLPTAKILTNLISVNIPVRIAFKVSTVYNSRCILGRTGAEQLQRPGDAILLHNALYTPFTAHYTPPDDIFKIAKYWANQPGPPTPPRPKKRQGGCLKFVILIFIIWIIFKLKARF